MDGNNNTPSSENPPPFPDLNENGVPDYKEPWLYRIGWRLLTHAIKQHPHTLASRALVKLEKFLEDLKKNGN